VVCFQYPLVCPINTPKYVRLWASARWGDLYPKIEVIGDTPVLSLEHHREVRILFLANKQHPVKEVPFIANCSTGDVSDSANFRAFEGQPSEKLEEELRRLLLQDGLPERINLTIGIAVPTPLLTIGSTFVPDQVDPRIWNRLNELDQNALRDYWRKYENVEGVPRNPDALDDVIDKARSIVGKYNSAVTWPLVQSLLGKLRNLPGVLLLSPPEEPSAIQTVDAEVPREVLPPLVDDRAIGFIGLLRSGTFALDVSAKAIRADYFWSQGYTGYPVSVGMIDTGVSPHLNLLPYRAAQFGSHAGTYDPCNHGTPVAGIIDSNHATYRGVSYNANLWNAKIADVDWLGRCTWRLQSIKNAAFWLVTNNVRIVSGTWSTGSDDNGNSAEALWLDWYANSGAVCFSRTPLETAGTSPTCPQAPTTYSRSERRMTRTLFRSETTRSPLSVHGEGQPTAARSPTSLLQASQSPRRATRMDGLP